METQTTKIEQIEDLVLNHNNQFSNINERYNEMRFGREGKMYTLWSVLPKSRIISEKFIQNLGIDYCESIEKALNLSKSISLIIDAPENLKDIVRGEDVMRFGKYKDKRICDLPDGYVLWVSEGGKVPNERFEGEFNYLLYNSPLREIATQEGIKRGLLGIFNDKVLPMKVIVAIKERIELNAMSEYFGSIGDKITSEVVMIDFKSYESNWGAINIYSFRDVNGNVLVYKGSSYLYHVIIYKDLNSDFIVNDKDKKFWKEAIHIGVEKGRYHTLYDSYNVTKEQREQLDSFDFKGLDANYVNLKTGQFWELENSGGEIIRKGDKFTITGTIKEHSEYNSTKQTILQRVSIL
jgi:uncharacterized protein (DUF3820 family)